VSRRNRTARRDPDAIEVQVGGSGRMQVWLGSRLNICTGHVVDVRDENGRARVYRRGEACPPGHCGQAYELTGGQLFTLGEMVAAIGGALGKPLTYTDTPPIAAGLAFVTICE
jgi:uncharacterized protein YbjT (DUF2867 family)